MKNSTKRSLIMSLLSMVLCMSMLIGSTFAWFTDEASSKGNKIQAGKLDVELLMYNGTEYVEISDSSAPIFGTGSIAQNNNAETLWEPGKTQVAYFAIKNAGNLALKYTVGLEVENVKNDLYEVMQYAITPDAMNGQAEKWQEGSGKAVAVGTQTVADFTELEKDTTHYFALSIHMLEDAGNKYQEGEVNFDLTVFATQLDAEEDSFGKDYDQDAEYGDYYVSTIEELDTALNEGGTVVLDGDITLNANARAAGKAETPLTVPEGISSTINLNGHNINYAAQASENGNFATIKVNGNLAITGNGTITASTNYNMGWGALSAVVSVEGGTLTVGEGVRLVNEGGTDMAYAVDVNTTLGETVLNVNGAELISTYTAVRIFNNNSKANGVVNFNSGLADGGSRDIWVHNPSASAVDVNGIVNIASAYEYDYTVTVQESSYNGRIYNFDLPTFATNVDSIKEALKNGDDVVMQDDVTAELTEHTIYGTPAAIVQKNGGTIDGNGHSLIIENPVYEGYAIETYGGTIKNLTIDATVGKGIVISTPTEDIYIDNVVIDGPGYAINTTEHGAKKLVVTNSTVNGWTSFAGLESATFTNCKFGENTAKYWQNMGYEQDYDRLIRPYVTTTFNNCVFEEGYYIDLSALGSGCTITLNNCTVNGVKVTAENYAEYITIELPSGRTLADCVVFN